MKQVAILSLIVLSSVWSKAQAQGLTESQVYLDIPGLCQREVQTAAINYAHAFDRSDMVYVKSSNFVSYTTDSYTYAVQVDVCDEYDRCSQEDFEVKVDRSAGRCDAVATYIPQETDRR